MNQWKSPTWRSIKSGTALKKIRSYKFPKAPPNNISKKYFCVPSCRIDIIKITIAIKTMAIVNRLYQYPWIDEKIPNIVLTDKLKISQVLINLLDNAYKFTENGNITLSAKVIKQKDTSTSIEFIVKDTGIGIEKTKKEDIFLPYKQVGFNTNKKYGGSGIGLAVVKDILNLLKSEIKVNSKINVGTSFIFTVDFNVPKAIKKVIPFSTFTDKENNKTTSILLVEDNKVNQLITSKIIRGFGFTCDIANDGFEAVSMEKQKDYDLILMDIMMPKMDGFEATKQIRKSNPNANIIALTALSETQNLHAFADAEIHSILTKPLHPKELYKGILDHIYLRFAQL